jgi:hypothetical protein
MSSVKQGQEYMFPKPRQYVVPKAAPQPPKNFLSHNKEALKTLPTIRPMRRVERMKKRAETVENSQTLLIKPPFASVMFGKELVDNEKLA